MNVVPLLGFPTMKTGGSREIFRQAGKKISSRQKQILWKNWVIGKPIKKTIKNMNLLKVRGGEVFLDLKKDK